MGPVGTQRAAATAVPGHYRAVHCPHLCQHPAGRIRRFVRDGSLRAQPEEIRAEMGPDNSLADVIRMAIREFIANRKKQ